jgi:hypothetical protein
MIRPHTFRRVTFVGLLLLAAVALQSTTLLGVQTGDALFAIRVNRLAVEVERAAAVRDVKELHHAYAQYAQFGLWSDMAALFAERAQFANGKETLEGRKAIGDHFLARYGEGKQGLPNGAMRTHLALRPLVNLSADGQSAKGRWWEFSMLGRSGVSAEWAAGIYENEYVKEQGFWKISRLRYYPMFAGPYETGWRNVDADQKIVPYHFTPEEAGIPVPEIPAGMAIPTSQESPAVRLAAIERRVSAMNDEDKVRNLQNAYGYYVDRKMWDDVTDLFTSDGVLELAAGVYKGVKGIRRALEISGPAGLKHGQLNDHMQLDMTVSILSGGTEARARGIEFAMLGEADKGEAYLALAVFENWYVKQNDVWRIREMRIFPVQKTDYRLGWARSSVVDAAPAKEFAPDGPTIGSSVGAAEALVNGASRGDGGVFTDHRNNAIPVFFASNPATGRPVTYPTGARVVGGERPPAPPAPRASSVAITASEMDARIKEAERKLAVSKAYDATENMSAAYGDYLDDLDFGNLAKIFALKGVKEIPFTGFYVGRESIARRESNSGQGAPRARTSLALHLRTQPVILVASDGRSASIRTRLFQPGSSRTQAQGFSGGMYNDQAVLENGSWKLWSVAIDEPYFSSPSYAGGWSAAKDPAPGAPGRGAVGTSSGYPPDIPLTALGERQKGFRGGTGTPIVWPSILPMWFHYRNPVSGRLPEHFWRDCVTCANAPHTSMKNHGWLLPPD